MEGSGCGLISGTIMALAWRDQGRPQKTSVRIVLCPDQDLAEHLQYISSEHYLQTSLFGRGMCGHMVTHWMKEMFTAGPQGSD
jgi:hypothetical protein